VSSKSRSISQRLVKIKDPDVRLKVAEEWVDEFKGNQESVVRKLIISANSGDMDQVEKYLAQLVSVTEKLFSALPRVLRATAGTHGIDSDEEG